MFRPWFLHDLERDRRHVGAGQCGLDHVQRMADRGGQDLRLEAVVVIDDADLADQLHPLV
jgi:hypothetical protein